MDVCSQKLWGEGERRGWKVNEGINTGVNPFCKNYGDLKRFTCNHIKYSYFSFISKSETRETGQRVAWTIVGVLPGSPEYTLLDKDNMQGLNQNQLQQPQQDDLNQSENNK